MALLPPEAERWRAAPLNRLALLEPLVIAWSVTLAVGAILLVAAEATVAAELAWEEDSVWDLCCRLTWILFWNSSGRNAGMAVKAFSRSKWVVVVAVVPDEVSGLAIATKLLLLKRDWGGGGGGLTSNDESSLVLDGTLGLEKLAKDGEDCCEEGCCSSCK